MSNKRAKNKQLKRKNDAGARKQKFVKFRRIKKIKFKDEKKVFLPNEDKETKVKTPSKRKLRTLYKKKEFKKKRDNQTNEYLTLKKELTAQTFDEQRRCLFAIRNNVECISSSPSEVLQKLKLTEKYHGVLLINTKANMKKLFLVKQYVCYGYIQKYTLYSLMEKKLFLKDGNEIKRCDSNKIVEKLFSKNGIYSFPSFCEYIFECKSNADQMMKEQIVPFNFSYLISEMTFDFLQFKNELAGFVKEGINEILEKII
ncbi:60s ribosomal protein L7, putative [Plasmodium vivax]|uniref:60s ribosomal protein L7, putative n=1 Tax=Plasmodium vivax (strain Salvador I) TaxID=126793 RepID=A5K2F4_PLAVS|nr:60s ribosomal protein L7, putative [Plasmodium vivax]EDL46604.1 60s ribosomal protein L7, putative [Plasmodium vivax]|eukprot:XP_001616331.1 60s ribosomal protein L7 [Plasmodium vivax Sal-1]